jgi:hypothetical protein
VNSAPYTEQDLTLVVHAGDWREVVHATAEERQLAANCALLEADLREREWAAFETVLPHIVDGVVVPPADGPERIAVLAAVVELGWHYPVLAGEECES